MFPGMSAERCIEAAAKWPEAMIGARSGSMRPSKWSATLPGMTRSDLISTLCSLTEYVAVMLPWKRMSFRGTAQNTNPLADMILQAAFGGGHEHVRKFSTKRQADAKSARSIKKAAAADGTAEFDSGHACGAARGARASSCSSKH
eukprot:CAMPEP_0180765102 /NCGR_PEP_ID=MMETSP1038_2-20121128/38800_1 /TAXON_ID=632150 /ORGANISM="Azadinium spinosum, Strain 3D9" /LENGTH=144 /DNA_ID=CAMNT_0022799559 /DNA_START=571 /DNA_END=1006 /DNA_ORIENTATION=-